MNQRVMPFLIAAGVVLLDRLTKEAIQSHFSAWDSLAVIPGFFNIVHTENPGIAFGLLADASGPWRDVLLIGFSLAVLLVISTVLARPDPAGNHGPIMRAGLGFVLGGAFGNLYDRLVHKTVTDFVEVHWGPYYFPAFNVADSAITVGACLLLLDMWRTREKKTAAVDVPR
jgi:signal peptidase II